METKRKTIGLYSKLRVGFVAINKTSNENIYNYLKKKKYTFSIRKLKKIEGMVEYFANVESIDEAYKLKLQLKKLNK